MTELLKQAMEILKQLPDEKQDELARMLLEVATWDGNEPALSL